MNSSLYLSQSYKDAWADYQRSLLNIPGWRSCFRSDEGATAYLRIMSYIGTAKKHGINAFRAIAAAFAGNPDMVIA